MRMISDNALAYTLDQAGHVCGLSADSIRRAVKSGALPARRTAASTADGVPRGRIIVLRRDLEAWLEQLPEDWWGSRY